MKLTEDLKKKIDAMTYRALLSQWRFAPVGDPIFQGESGDYFGKVLKEKEKETPDRVQISKDLGWGR